MDSCELTPNYDERKIENHAYGKEAHFTGMHRNQSIHKSKRRQRN